VFSFVEAGTAHTYEHLRRKELGHKQQTDETSHLLMSLTLEGAIANELDAKHRKLRLTNLAEIV